MELRIDRERVDRCRALSASIVAPVEAFIAAHSTVSVERAVLRLLGLDGVGHDEIPVPNVIVDSLSGPVLARGIAMAIGKAVAETGLDPAQVGAAVAAGDLDLARFEATPGEAARAALAPHVEAGVRRLRERRSERSQRLERLPQLPPPLLYVIVASGN